MSKVFFEGVEYFFIPQAPLITATEEWLFYTNILRALAGDEEAISITDLPQVDLNYSWVFSDPSAMAAAYNLFYSGMRSDWLIPAWNYMCYLEGYDYLTNTVTLADAKYRPFKVGSKVLLKNKESWQVLVVSAIEGNDVIFGGIITTPLNGAIIVPCYFAYIDGDLQRNVNFKISTIEVKFSLKEFIEIAPAESAERFNGYDFWKDCMIMGSGMGEVVFSQQQDVFNSGIGRREQRTLWTKPYTTKTVQFYADNFDEAYSLRRWLMRRLGQATPFYVPLYENMGEILNDGYVSNKLTVKSEHFEDVQGKRGQFTVKVNGNWVALDLTNVTQIAPNTFELSFAQNLNTASLNISKITYLSLHRLGSDVIQFEQQGLGATVVSTNLIEV